MSHSLSHARDVGVGAAYVGQGDSFEIEGPTGLEQLAGPLRVHRHDPGCAAMSTTA